jgi:hypothetical protein
MRLAEEKKIVPVLNYDDMDTGTALDGDSINMKNYHRATFIVNLHDIGTASPVLYLYSGAIDGAKTSALTFHYAFGSAAQGTADCDVLGADSTSAALTLTHGTYDNYMLIVEIDADVMDVANSEEWLTISFTDPGTATGHVTVTAILEPRYIGNCSATALA